MATKKAIELSYENMEKLIQRICHDFWRCYKGSPDEILSEACEHFMRAYYSHDPELSQFSTWMRKVVWYGLLETKVAKAACAQKRQGLHVDTLQSRYKFDLEQFIGELSADGATAVRTALNPPIWVLRIMKRGKGTKPGPKRKAAQRAIRQVLSNKGWEDSRINKAFEEVRGALL